MQTYSFYSTVREQLLCTTISRARSGGTCTMTIADELGFKLYNSDFDAQNQEEQTRKYCFSYFIKKARDFGVKIPSQFLEFLISNSPLQGVSQTTLLGRYTEAVKQLYQRDLLVLDIAASVDTAAQALGAFANGNKMSLGDAALLLDGWVLTGPRANIVNDSLPNFGIVPDRMSLIVGQLSEDNISESRRATFAQTIAFFHGGEVTPESVIAFLENSVF